MITIGLIIISNKNGNKNMFLKEQIINIMILLYKFRNCNTDFALDFNVGVFVFSIHFLSEPITNIFFSNFFVCTYKILNIERW